MISRAVARLHGFFIWGTSVMIKVHFDKKIIKDEKVLFKKKVTSEYNTIQADI